MTAHDVADIELESEPDPNTNRSSSSTSVAFQQSIFTGLLSVYSVIVKMKINACSIAI